MSQKGALLFLWIIILAAYFRLSARMFFDWEIDLVACFILAAVTISIPSVLLPLAKTAGPRQVSKLTGRSANSSVYFFQLAISLIVLAAFGGVELGALAEIRFDGVDFGYLFYSLERLLFDTIPDLFGRLMFFMLPTFMVTFFNEKWSKWILKS